MRTALLLALAAATAAADDEHRLEPDHAPTPFTAPEIRKGCPEGRACTFLVEIPERDPIRRTIRFVKCDEKGADVEVSQAKKDGTALGEPKTSRATWKDLQGHASYPEKETRITEERVEVPAGKFDCLLYTVTTKKDEKTTVTRAWFAKALPGPPVKMTSETDGARAFSMALVENKMP